MADGVRGRSSGNEKGKPPARVGDRSGQEAASPVIRPFTPLTPRSGWLVVMSFVFAAWMALMGYLYLTTVYARPSPAPTTAEAFTLREQVSTVNPVLEPSH